MICDPVKYRRKLPPDQAMALGLRSSSQRDPGMSDPMLTPRAPTTYGWGVLPAELE